MSPLEILAFVINTIGVWLTAQRIRWCWPVSILAVLLYAWLFYEWKLYSDMLLQGIYALLQSYGWYYWSRDKNEAGQIEVVPLLRNELILSLITGSFFALVLGWIMHTYTDAALPWIDSALTSFSLVASVWTARKHIANWTLWIILDAIYVAVFIYKHLYLTAGLYAVFVILAMHGLKAWRREPSAPVSDEAIS